MISTMPKILSPLIASPVSSLTPPCSSAPKPCTLEAPPSTAQARSSTGSFLVRLFPRCLPADHLPPAVALHECPAVAEVVRPVAGMLDEAEVQHGDVGGEGTDLHLFGRGGGLRLAGLRVAHPRCVAHAHRLEALGLAAHHAGSAAAHALVGSEQLGHGA